MAMPNARRGAPTNTVGSLSSAVPGRIQVQSYVTIGLWQAEMQEGNGREKRKRERGERKGMTQRGWKRVAHVYSRLINELSLAARVPHRPGRAVWLRPRFLDIQLSVSLLAAPLLSGPSKLSSTRPALSSLASSLSPSALLPPFP